MVHCGHPPVGQFHHKLLSVFPTVVWLANTLRLKVLQQFKLSIQGNAWQLTDEVLEDFRAKKHSRLLER